MGKEVKTNAMRILERMKIPYQLLQYECKEFIDGIHVADATGVPREQSFKTLVAQGKSGAYYVLVLPVELEVHLKAAAKIVGEKSIEMLKSKELLPLTGYVHGGCSPIGMKKVFTTFLHSTAKEQEHIIFSAGKIGYQVEVAPEDLAKVVRFTFADVIK